MITFDKDSHSYFVNGVPIRCVSDIIRRSGLSDYSIIPDDVLQYATERGKAVHVATEYADRDILCTDSVCGKISPYLNAWSFFKYENDVKILEIEKIVYSKKLWYAGTVDRILSIGGVECIVDIKTASRVNIPAARMQLAAYAIAVDKKIARMVVQLKKDGNYTLIRFSKDEDIKIFTKMSEVDLWKTKNGVK
jgi:hypothetical protein